MSNISFDNVYLLFLIIPLVALTAVPFALAIRRENVNGHNVASLVIHILIAVLVSFAIAGTMVTTVITETEVYVVADVSYSANRNLDTVDSYIQNVRSSLPANSRMGVVAFGKDYELLSDLGEDLVSVRQADVDDSATDISGALSYTSGLFHDGVIKRIVLITDGRETDPNAFSTLMGTVNSLYDNNIYVDAIYLNDNIPADTPEVQVSSVDFNQSAFMGRASDVDVIVRSGSTRNVTITFSVCEEGSDQSRVIQRLAPTLTTGDNVFTFELDTSAPGTFNYTVDVAYDGSEDVNTLNDSYTFTQTVTEKMKVCLVIPSGTYRDESNLLEELYGEDAEVETYLAARNDVPVIVEDLCQYDQIVLSNTDLTVFSNYESLIDALNIVVSLYGKSLITLGDMAIQSKEDDSLTDLQDMLPVNFGNNSLESKHIIFVLDNSFSMTDSGYLTAAKNAITKIVDNFVSAESAISLVNFYGDASFMNWPNLGEQNYNSFMARLENIEGQQGTDIGLGLEVAMNNCVGIYPDKNSEIFLISDGVSFGGSTTDPRALAEEMYNSGVVTSCIYVGPSDDYAERPGIDIMESVASAGRGGDDSVITNFYEITSGDEVDDVIVGQMGPVINESEIHGQTAVNIEIENDSVVEDISSVPDVSGYYFSRLKNSAVNVLTMQYTSTQSGVSTDVPLYSYWNYGNGRVASFTSSLHDGWLADWTEENGGLELIRNILFTNTPEQRVDHPFIFNADYTDGYASFELMPYYLTASATATIQITFPDGQTVQTNSMAFGSELYSYGFVPEQVGRYSIDVTYSVSGREFTAHAYLAVPFLSEYDSFAYYSAATLNRLLSGRGTVSEDGTIELINPEDELSTYSVSLTMPLLIAAVALFVVDIVIRKLKWNDIKSIFVKIK